VSKVAICVPWPHEQIPTLFLRSLWESDVPKDAVLYVGVAQAGPMARNKMIRRGLEEGIEEFLFFDADQVWPRETYAPLHDADVDIISGFVPRESYPHPFCVWVEAPDGRFANLTPMKGGPIKVHSVGAGCLLIRRKVFETIPAPWFPMELNEDHTLMPKTADVMFCDKARTAGFDIYAHGNVFPGHAKTIFLDKNYAQNCQIQEMAREMAEKKVEQSRIALAGRRSIYVPA
jgi:hypothetical protein